MVQYTCGECGLIVRTNQPDAPAPPVCPLCKWLLMHTTEDERTPVLTELRKLAKSQRDLPS